MSLCATCDTGTRCLTCENPINRTLENNQCVCNSVAGYWENGDNCTLCK